MGEEEALPELAAERLQSQELRLCLDSLGDDGQAELGPKRDNRLEQRVAPRARVAGPDEGLVDLDDPGMQVHEVGERGVPRAEVVEGDPDPEPVEVLDDPRGDGDVAERDALGDLDDETARRESAQLEGPVDLGDEARVVKLSSGQIDPMYGATSGPVVRTQSPATHAASLSANEPRT